MILPKPKQIITRLGFFDLKLPINIQYPQELLDLKIIVKENFSFTKGNDNQLIFIYQKDLAREGYQLDIELNSIKIHYHTYRGAVYALMTLYQLKADQIPCQSIIDEPDVEIRGYMQDISRDRVLTTASIKTLIDHMMLLKMNHLELYVEGYPLELPSFPELPYETPITVEEYQELETYARIRGIDLVPNINVFGHMEKWLKLEAYNYLSECPNGFERVGKRFPPATLDPLNKDSIKLAKTIVKDFLSFSKSRYFNLNCDEPFELGLGKSKEQCEKFGLGKVYVDYLDKVSEVVVEAKREPWVWGDIIAKHPEVLPDFPKTLTVIEWGYNYNHDFTGRTTRLQENHIDFLLAPGTSSWNSFAYRHKDMIGSTNLAIDASKEFGGKGLLMTDWGDHGHPQPIIFSYPGLAYIASETWTTLNDYQPVETWLKKEIFTCNPNHAKLIRLLGEYSSLEERYVSNGTGTFHPWRMTGFYPKDSLEEQFTFWKDEILKMHFSQNSQKAVLDRAELVLNQVHGLNDLVSQEIRLSARLIKLCVLLHNLVLENNINNIETILNLVDRIDQNYEEIWLERCRAGGLKDSVRRLKTIREFLLHWERLNAIQA